MEVGEERDYIYPSLHCHHQIDSCFKMGSDVSLSVRDKVTTVSTNHNVCERKGEPKRYRTEVLLLSSLTPYR